MGFERIVAVLQNKKSNYETDVFAPIIDKISEISGVEYSEKDDVVAVQVIADHIRTLTFAIADGATPGNEGRGYVLRRILRRAARFGRKLNFNKPFMYSLVDVLTETMGEVFPEIVKNKENIIKIIKAEEESFNRTLDRGIELFEQIANKVKDEVKIKGEDVFKLYDTFGFPVDLTNVMAEEKGLTIDEARFNELMDEQKERARSSTKNKLEQVNVLNDSPEIDKNKKSDFIGYDYGNLITENIVDTVVPPYLFLEQTPFYAESGGQVGDTGLIIDKDGNEIKIVDTIKTHNLIAHKFEGNAFDLVGTKVNIKVDNIRRWDIMRNHSATHLMHAALRKVLGEHVKQSGSLVDDEKLRFDFTNFEKVSADEIKEIEQIVNSNIGEGIKRQSGLRDIPFEQAKEMGALMFFGDKYGDKVNVIKFGDYSTEFCGGTHVNNTSEIGIFKIVSESSIASGVRRIEAVTCNGVAKLIEELGNEIIEVNQHITDSRDGINTLKNDILKLSSQKIESNSIESELDILEQKRKVEEKIKLFNNCNISDLDNLLKFISDQENISSKLSDQLMELKNEKRNLDKEISGLELKSKLGGIDEIIKSPIDINGIKFFKGKVEATSMDELKSMGDELRNKIKSGVGVLISAIGEKVGIVCVVSDDLIKGKKIQAGKIVGLVAKIVGGGGGGRPHLATAGGRDISKIDEALEKTNEIIEGLLD